MLYRLVEDPGSGEEYTEEALDSQRTGNIFAAAVDQWVSNAKASGEGVPDSMERGSWAMSHCWRCKMYSIWRDKRLIYPPSSTVPLPSDAMPDDAKELYNEAREVVGISRRAGAALARASLERLLRSVDQMEGRPDLAARIDHVIDRVSVSLGEMLTVIRHAGNKSLHVEDEPDEVMVLILDPDEAEIVDLIFESINDLVDELVVRPARKRAAFEKVPQRIRDQIGKKPDRKEQS